jgi:hypothetical protein
MVRAGQALMEAEFHFKLSEPLLRPLSEGRKPGHEEVLVLVQVSEVPKTHFVERLAETVRLEGTD